MAYINENYLKLPGNYLFAEVARRVAAFRSEHPDAEVIRLGIGDVTLPLPAVSIEAMHTAVDEMAKKETFRGYGPEQGYDFLIDAIIERNYTSRGLSVERDEVFVSDGSKSDCGNIQEIFSSDAVVAITDPVYPVYLDTNVMAGRTGALGTDGRFEGVVYLPSTEENGFAPSLPDRPVDMIYLCCPNNPTGTTLSRAELAKWVSYARENDAVILFDAAYAAYITEPDVPHSIYELDGARDVAIEFRSFSKTAGFTGTRCGYTVIPKTVTAKAKDGSRHPLNALWSRRHSTKFNGTAYIVQRGAAAIYTDEGQKQAVRSRSLGLRRRERALYLAQDAEPDAVLDVFRQAAPRGERRRHSRRGLRSLRRGVFPAHRFRRSRGHGKSRRPHSRKTGRIKTLPPAKSPHKQESLEFCPNFLETAKRRS